MASVKNGVSGSDDSEAGVKNSGIAPPPDDAEAADGSSQAITPDRTRG
jgi:hypothetical protein